MTKKLIILGITAAFVLFSCNTADSKPEESNPNMNPGPVEEKHEEKHEMENFNQVLNWHDFMLPNHVLLDSMSGDLNHDGIDDMILILKRKDEEIRAFEHHEDDLRPLLLLLGNTDGSYVLAARNDNTVLCYSCGGALGDPYTGIAIKNGYFSLEHYGGSSNRWTRIITYKYDKTKGHWFLHKDGAEFMGTHDLDYYEEDIKTTKDFGVVRFENFDINN